MGFLSPFVTGRVGLAQAVFLSSSTGAGAGGFRSTRCTVAAEMRWPLAICRRLCPWQRSRRMASRSRTKGLRPMCVPPAFPALGDCINKMSDNRNEILIRQGSKPRRPKLVGSIITMPTDQDVMTLEEAAEFFKCNPATLKRRADALHIPYRRLGSLWRFSRMALEAWMADADNAKAA